jgi:hypothetical protein
LILSSIEEERNYGTRWPCSRKEIVGRSASFFLSPWGEDCSPTDELAVAER